MVLFLKVFLTEFIAEMGDKTQLMLIALTSKYKLKDIIPVSYTHLKEYQNQHIGRRCVLEMLKLAREKGMERVKANIYSFNGQSQRMFQSVGFEDVYKRQDLRSVLL